MRSWSEYDPSTKLSELSDLLVQAARSGMFEMSWARLHISVGGHRATVAVATDALSLDGVRVCSSHTTAQQIVDELGLSLPTTKIADLAHQQADVVVRPCIQQAGPAMSTVGAMLEHSHCVDASISGRAHGLVSTVGKHWVLSNKLGERPDVGVNFGWHDPSAPYKSPGGLRLWQPLATAHNRFHVDYSQVVVPVHPWMDVDGRPMLLWEVMADENLCSLVSYEGPIRFSRHPGVEPPAGGVRVDASRPAEGSAANSSAVVGAVFAAAAAVGWLGARAVSGRWAKA